MCLSKATREPVISIYLQLFMPPTLLGCVHTDVTLKFHFQCKGCCCPYKLTSGAFAVTCTGTKLVSRYGLTAERSMSVDNPR